MTTENIGTEVGEGVDPVETHEDALVAGYFGIKKDPEPNDIYTVTGSAARQDELFAAPEAANSSLPRRGPGRPRKDAGERKD